MIISTFSARQFRNCRELSFCPEKYSRFKYGSKSIAREFGRELGSKFLNSCGYRELQEKFDLSEVPILISSAPYKFTPTASHALKDYFIYEFNKTHATKFGRSIEEIKIYRAHSYFDDYGSMSREERDAAITSDDFYIDEKLIKNKILFLIDDIKITGSHQSRIEKLLDSADFSGTVVFLFYAELIGGGDPQIEGFLNKNAIKDLKDVEKTVEGDEFLFNTRVVKFILHSKPDDFVAFIQNRSRRFNETLFHYSIGNEYFREPAFKTNFLILRSFLEKQEIQHERI